MAIEITRGKQRKGVKFLIYGPEGIGKSTFVSNIPGIVFIDTEGSTGEMDVPRLPAPSSWQMLLDEVDYAMAHPEEVKALVIDTADWAERLATDHVLRTHLINGAPANSIEDYGYGKGYTMLYEEFGRLLNKLQDMSDRGVHVGMTAHAKMRKFEQPDELGAYDRWELKLSKGVAPLVKEWASLMLFANYKTIVYVADDKGKKHKASGGQRVMYSTHHVCWDAKNRYGLADELPFDFSAVKDIFADIPVATSKGSTKASIDDVLGEVPAIDPAAGVKSAPAPAAAPAPAPAPAAAMEKADKLPDSAAAPVDYTGVPEKLADLMRNDGITPFEVKAAVAQRGYFPVETPWEAYPIDFVNGVLIGAWNGVRTMVLENRQKKPF